MSCWLRYFVQLKSMLKPSIHPKRGVCCKHRHNSLSEDHPVLQDERIYSTLFAVLALSQFDLNKWLKKERVDELILFVNIMTQLKKPEAQINSLSLDSGALLFLFHSLHSSTPPRTSGLISAVVLYNKWLWCARVSPCGLREKYRCCRLSGIVLFQWFQQWKLFLADRRHLSLTLWHEVSNLTMCSYTLRGDNSLCNCSAALWFGRPLLRRRPSVLIVSGGVLLS